LIRSRGNFSGRRAPIATKHLWIVAGRADDPARKAAGNTMTLMTADDPSSER